jgi:MFS family permease
MDIAPKEVSSEYFGTFLAAISLAIAISPLIAGVIISDGMVASLPLLVTVYSILTIVSICLFIVLYEPITKRRSTREGLARIVIEDKLFVSAIKEFKKLRTIGLVIVFLSFFLTLMDGIMWSFEPLYYEELGFDPTTGGLIIFAYLAPLVFCQIPAGYIADRYGKIKPMLVGLALGGASLVLFGLVSDLTSILLTALSSALGLSLAWPAVSGLIIDVSVNRNKGSISGVWNMAMDSASVVAPLLGGIISLMYVGVGGIFVAVGVLSLVMAPILVLLLRRSQAMLQ